MLIGIVLMGSGCDKDTPPDCGCDSVTIRTILESDNMLGRISYKTQIDPLDDFYNNTFWIGYEDISCPSCIHKMIVCNEDIFGSDFNDIIISGESVEISFAGHLKELCNNKFDVTENTYHRIVLTSIERL